MKIIIESEQEKEELLALSQYLHDFTFFNDVDSEGNLVLQIISKMTHTKSTEIIEEGCEPVVVYKSEPEEQEIFPVTEGWYSLDFKQSPLLNIFAHLFSDVKNIIELDYSNEGEDVFNTLFFRHFKSIADNEKISVDEAIQKYYILSDRKEDTPETSDDEHTLFTALENNLWNLVIKKDDAEYIAKA